MRQHCINKTFLVVTLLSLTVYLNDCNAQLKPWTLRGCMRYLNRTIDDTTKYDFKISPLDYCFGKHGFGAGFRNSMGLWRFNPLTFHFRLRGIRHPDDMSSIIKQSFHRYLNDEPIKFREQKKKYQTYWSEIDKGKDYNEVYYELWEKNAIPDSILKIEYLKLFHTSRKVRGYFTIAKWTSKSSIRDEYVDYIAEVIETNDSLIKILIINVGQIDEDFEFADMFLKREPKQGDTIDVDPCLIYLIPDE